MVLLVVPTALVMLALVSLFLLTPHPPKAPADCTSPEALRTYFGTLADHETPPALEATVIRDGRTVFAEAFGSIGGRRSVTNSTDAVYHYWSVTKLFTATAIMQLAEDGKLRLDEPVTKYLPGFTTSYRHRLAPITIHQLLRHDSGMQNLKPGDLMGWIHHLQDPPIRQSTLLKERMSTYRQLAAAPGTTSAYSNAGYIVLSAIIERVSGKSYEEFVRARILRPLGMTSTDFEYRGDMLARAISGTHPLFHLFTPLLVMMHHDWFSTWVTHVSRRRMWLAPLYTDYTGPTGLIGTGRDLARFGLAFVNGGELDGVRILKSETVAEMLNEDYGGNTGPDRDRMGLGWHWWNNEPIAFKGHGGDGPGFSAQLAVFPERKMVVVVLANDMLTDRLGLTRLVARVFH